LSILQLSELIRGAADGAQNNTQHKVLLQQLHQLCSYIGLQKLQDPAQQMAAVLQYVQEVRSVLLHCYASVSLRFCREVYITCPAGTTVAELCHLSITSHDATAHANTGQAATEVIFCAHCSAVTRRANSSSSCRLK
jgi:hypothetical protein